MLAGAGLGLPAPVCGGRVAPMKAILAALLLAASLLCPPAHAQQEMSPVQVAFPIYLEQAKKGNPHYQYALGDCYFHGDGVKQNRAEAVKWYRKAAEQGLSVAQDALKKIASDETSGRTNRAKAELAKRENPAEKEEAWNKKYREEVNRQREADAAAQRKQAQREQAQREQAQREQAQRERERRDEIAKTAAIEKAAEIAKTR